MESPLVSQNQSLPPLGMGMKIALYVSVFILAVAAIFFVVNRFSRSENLLTLEEKAGILNSLDQRASSTSSVGATEKRLSLDDVKVRSASSASISAEDKTNLLNALKGRN